MTTYMRTVLKQKCTKEASHILLFVVESDHDALELLLLLRAADERVRVPAREYERLNNESNMRGNNNCTSAC